VSAGGRVVSVVLGAIVMDVEEDVLERAVEVDDAAAREDSAVAEDVVWEGSATTTVGPGAGPRSQPPAK